MLMLQRVYHMHSHRLRYMHTTVALAGTVLLLLFGIPLEEATLTKALPRYIVQSLAQLTENEKQPDVWIDKDGESLPVAVTRRS